MTDARQLVDALLEQNRELPPLQQLMLHLDSSLTGHSTESIVRQYHHYPATVEAWLEEVSGGNPMWYLSDSGYSRIVWDPCGKSLFLTDNSRREVVARWDAAMPERMALLRYLNAEYDRLGGYGGRPMQESDSDPLSPGRHTFDENGSYYEIERHSNGDATVERLFVPPDLRGGGISRAMLEFIVAGADRAGVTLHVAIAPDRIEGEGHEHPRYMKVRNALEKNFADLGFESAADGEDVYPLDKSRAPRAESLEEARAPKLDVLKDNRTELDPAERRKVMAAKAVWHHGPGGKESPAVWKSVVRGTTWFVCNTHRCYRAAKTLSKAVRDFKFIKTTA